MVGWIHGFGTHRYKGQLCSYSMIFLCRITWHIIEYKKSTMYYNMPEAKKQKTRTLTIYCKKHSEFALLLFLGFYKTGDLSALLNTDQFKWVNNKKKMKKHLKWIQYPKFLLGIVYLCGENKKCNGPKHYHWLYFYLSGEPRRSNCE